MTALAAELALGDNDGGGDRCPLLSATGRGGSEELVQDLRVRLFTLWLLFCLRGGDVPSGQRCREMLDMLAQDIAGQM